MPNALSHAEIMPSSTGVVTPQISGFLTNEWCLHIHIFVEDSSDFTHNCCTKSTEITNSIVGKHGCEQKTCNNRKKFIHYHADNGFFARKGLKYLTHADKKSIRYCGVSAHFQNGKAENRIKKFCSVARTMIINATHESLQEIAPSLWVFAMPTSLWF